MKGREERSGIRRIQRTLMRQINHTTHTHTHTHTHTPPPHLNPVESSARQGCGCECLHDIGQAREGRGKKIKKTKKSM